MSLVHIGDKTKVKLGLIGWNIRLEVGITRAFKVKMALRLLNRGAKVLKSHFLEMGW